MESINVDKYLTVLMNQKYTHVTLPNTVVKGTIYMEEVESEYKKLEL